MDFPNKTWYRITLLFILAASGFLAFYGIGREGYANTYYAAAVKSMLMNWHNFFFVSFDPGGFVSVDKPPVALWLQAASAKLLGFHGWSLILPQALAAVVSVALLYHLVQRTFGKTAGLLAAAALAVTPVLAAVSRTNEVDTVLVALVLLAGWALMAAAERSSLKLLLLATALVGIGFNVKMLEAFMVLPAFYLVYWFFSGRKAGRKAAHLAAATALLLAVSLSWATVVDMTPAAARPYVGSSRTNSVLQLAVGYNGIQRVLPAAFGQPGSGFTRAEAAGAELEAGLERSFTAAFDGQGFHPGLGGGPPGVFRLLDQQMAGQIIWLLPLALLGSLGIYLRSRDPAVRRNYRLALVFWGMWVLPMMAYFSIAGFFHTYYMVILAPGLAALAGIGTVEMYRLWREEKGWKAFILPVALSGNLGLQVFMLSRHPQWSAWLTPVAAVSAVCAVVLALLKTSGRAGLAGAARVAAAAGFAALLVAPAAWAATPVLYGVNPVMPAAGPASMGRGDRGLGFPGGDISRLVAFLVRQDPYGRYLVAVPNAAMAAPIILQTGRAVMAVGGFLGSDPILTVPRLQQLAADGEVRYFLVMDGGAPGLDRSGTRAAVIGWVASHGTLVPSSEWGGGSTAGGRFGSMRLYDLGAVQTTFS